MSYATKYALQDAEARILTLEREVESLARVLSILHKQIALLRPSCGEGDTE